MKVPKRSYFLALFLLLCSICQLQASKVFELKVIDQNYVMIHFKDGDALYVDDGVGPGSLREYNYDDLDNNYIVRYRDPLAVNNLNVAANWLISSTDDGNYSTSGIAPLSVARKTKYNGTEQVVFSNGWQHDYTTEHYVILQMPSPLQQGNSYTINLPGNIEADANQISFTYNYLSSRSDAIHINTVGYPSLSSIKSADLYYWLGDAGPRDYASFEGNRVFLVNIANEVATEVGTVQFWRNSSTEYDGHDFIQSPVWNVDFTGFNTPGSYRLAVEGVGCSDEFEIRSDIYFEPFKVSTQGYYFMRVGQAANANPNSPCVPRQPLFNVNQNSPAGIRVVRTSFGPSHPNWSDNWDQVQFPDTWAQYVLPNSENPNAFGGHSDARDWDRHLNHAISAWDMLLPYILTDGALSDDDLGIAESGNGVPDIIDEAREQVDFFFRLRDENGGFAWGLSNPNNGIGANGVIYQTWATAYAAWANAANCAMLGQAYQIAGQNTLTTDYTNKAIEAWNQAESYTDEQLDFIWDFGLAHLKGRDLKFMAAAYLYNLTGNSSYEQVIVNESVISGPSQDIMQLGTSGNTGGPGFNQLWGTVGYLVADRPYNNRSIGNQTLYNQMQSSLIWSAQQFEQGESNNRASRRPNFGPYSLYPTTTHLNRTIAAHAFATNSSVKRDLLDALLLEADYTLGRNASNHIQMTTASTSLQTNRSIEVVYTTGSDDGAPGFHPGHTPYADYDVFGGGQEGDVSLLLNSCYPSSGNWPVGELFFNSAHFFPHTEFTPQQTMRGKQALYGYLYGISGGRTPLAATYKLEVDNGSGSGFYAPGATVSISAAAPPIGHIFQEWVSNNAYIDDYYLADATDPNTSVTMPERGHLYLKATYQIPPPAQYQLTVNNGLGAGTYEAGEEVTLIANTPNPGLRFSNWTGAVNNISYPSDGQNKAAIKIIMPAQDISMTANYESGQQSYTVCGSLENAGFEEAWFGWNPSNATLSSDARSGDWAALGFSRAGVFAKFDVDPGSFSTVELKMWVKTIGDSGFSSFGLDFLDSGGNVMQAEKLEIPHGTTTGWEEFTGSKTIPPNTASINIWVYADNGQILYDDACLIFDGGSGPTCSNVTNAGSINYSGQTTVAASSYDPPNISNSSTASGGAGGSIVYRWQQRENGGSWSTISGATGSSYNPPSITSSTDFRRQAQRDCQSSWVSSNVISITLSTPPGCENVTSAGSINYGGQTNVAANSFDPPNISNGSAASGGTGGSIVYRWQQRENGGSWSTLNGVTGSSYNPPSISTSTDFRRQAQRDCQISWISSNLISIALTPPGGGSDLIVHARGTTGEEVISLQIDGVTVSSWTITTSLADYVYPNYSGGTSTPIQVLFDNDGLSSNNVDKNFFLDYIIIDGTTYQTETNAERLPVGACGDDQWLWCNGYFEFFGGVQPPT
ncbi:MAG: carbohydrate-binding domain-containing protein, partial [Bacteroidota bacterium]